MTRIPYTGRFRVILEFNALRSSLWDGEGYHIGIDLCGITSTKVYSTVCGIIEFAGDGGDNFGNYVCICESGTKRKHYFCHLAEVKVKKGAFVTPFTVIGTEGTSGRSTARHLHYEIRDTAFEPHRALNPAAFMHIPNARGIYQSSEYALPQRGERLITRRYPFREIKNVWVARSDSAKSAAEWQLETKADEIFNLSKFDEFSRLVDSGNRILPCLTQKKSGKIYPKLHNSPYIFNLCESSAQPVDCAYRNPPSFCDNFVFGAPCLVWNREKLPQNDTSPAAYQTAVCLYPDGIAVIQGGKATPSELADYAIWEGMTHALLQGGKTNTLFMQNGKVAYSPDGGRQICSVLCINLKK